ncbi:ATP-dependent helicase [Clostridium botulinum]|nr:ATP-dependent helicase [Clostridium botulinum]
MQPIDYDIREQILNEKANIAISASAGTGKTYTTVQKIAKELNENKDYRTFAAITFTRKAAKEIEQRLGVNKNDGFVGTNDNFVLREIIQPFMYDVYGRDYKKDIIPDYSNENMFMEFDDGISKIKDSQLICKYSDNHKNFAFQLALDILKQSKAARRYINSKYYRIYVDEYQDSDKDMHNLFMYICKTINVPLFIVGDIKQSIYGWRGGYVDGFKEVLADTKNFNIFKLKQNFRSNKPIQNYSNLFMDDVRENYQLVEVNDKIQMFTYNKISEIVSVIKSWIKNSQNCAFLVRKNDVASSFNKLLINNGIDFTYLPSSPLDNSNLESEHIWIARILAFYLLQDRFSEYDVLSEIPSSDSFDYNKIKRILKNVKKNKKEYKLFEDSCIKLYTYLGYVSSEKIEKEIKQLFNVISDERYIPTYNPKNYDHIITTIHSSKGLEYKQVIILTEDYNLLNENDKYLHYVAVSRPEERLLILNRVNNKNMYNKVLEDNIKNLNKIGFKVSREHILKDL